MNSISSRAFFAVGKHYSLDVSVHFGPISNVQVLRLEIQQPDESDFIIECQRLLPAFFKALHENHVMLNGFTTLASDSKGWYEYDSCYVNEILTFVRACNLADDEVANGDMSPFSQVFIW